MEVIAMTVDDKLAADEERRIAQQEELKGVVDREIKSEVVRSAVEATPTERKEADALAANFRRKAVADIAQTGAEIERARGVARVSQIIDYIFYLIYGIITLEIVLDLAGAREGNGFRRFIDGLANPLLSPFRGLLEDPSRGQIRLKLSFIFALVVYVLLHMAINGLLRLFAHRKTAV
jgi:uncharacterized protein YggT (Ycf19 family)